MVFHTEPGVQIKLQGITLYFCVRTGQLYRMVNCLYFENIILRRVKNASTDLTNAIDVFFNCLNEAEFTDCQIYTNLAEVHFVHIGKQEARRRYLSPTSFYEILKRAPIFEAEKNKELIFKRQNLLADKRHTPGENRYTLFQPMARDGIGLSLIVSLIPTVAIALKINVWYGLLVMALSIPILNFFGAVYVGYVDFPKWHRDLPNSEVLVYFDKIRITGEWQQEDVNNIWNEKVLRGVDNLDAAYKSFEQALAPPV